MASRSSHSSRCREVSWDQTFSARLIVDVMPVIQPTEAGKLLDSRTSHHTLRLTLTRTLSEPTLRTTTICRRGGSALNGLWSFIEACTVSDSQKTASSVGARTIRKVQLRILPVLFVLYVICYLGRVNVGIAALTMNEDHGGAGKKLASRALLRS